LAAVVDAGVSACAVGLATLGTVAVTSTTADVSGLACDVAVGVAAELGPQPLSSAASSARHTSAKIAERLTDRFPPEESLVTKRAA
jgi:hypothetical protein